MCTLEFTKLDGHYNQSWVQYATIITGSQDDLFLLQGSADPGMTAQASWFRLDNTGQLFPARVPGKGARVTWSADPDTTKKRLPILNY